MDKIKKDGIVEARGVHKRYTASSRKEADVTALRDINLSLREGELYVLLGASGSGKTTLLRCVAGLEVPDAGEIHIDGETVFSYSRHIVTPPESRPLAMVFQSYALWPHMSVYKNIAFPLRHGLRRMGGQNLKGRVEDVVALMGLTEQMHRPVTRLSGGQQQRVALARALALEPRVLLMDEPLSNLDAKLRAQLRVELKHLTKRIGITTLYVTHDQAEAMVLGDRMSVMDRGRIVQEGTPWELYKRPKNLFVAQFLGDLNVFGGAVEKSQGEFCYVSTEGGTLKVVPFEGLDRRSVKIAIRLEDVAVTSGPGENVLLGRMSERHFFGEGFLYHVQIGSMEIRIRRAGSDEILEQGQDVWLYFPPLKCIAFSPEAT